MQKRLALCLLTSLLGILLLFALNTLLKPEKLTISKITNEKLNSQIQLEAKVTSIRDFPKSSFQILTLEDKTGRIEATSNSNRQLLINLNQSYTFIGKITKNFYNNQTTLQLSLDKITKLRKP